MNHIDSIKSSPWRDSYVQTHLIKTLWEYKLTNLYRNNHKVNWILWWWIQILKLTQWKDIWSMHWRLAEPWPPKHANIPRKIFKKSTDWINSLGIVIYARYKIHTICTSCHYCPNSNVKPKVSNKYMLVCYNKPLWLQQFQPHQRNSKHSLFGNIIH